MATIRNAHGVGAWGVRQLVLAEVAPKLGLSPRQVTDLQAQLLSGLMVHLQSVPVGLRIGRWIWQSFDDFHTTQRQLIQKELATNREALRSEIRKLMPKPLMDATLAINAAYALFWARELNDPELANGYQNNFAERQGQKLLALWDEIPPEADYDRNLVDGWADQLGLRGWYQWLPYTALD